MSDDLDPFNDLASEFDLGPEVEDATDIRSLSDADFESLIAEAKGEASLPVSDGFEGDSPQHGDAQQRAEMAVWAAYGAEYRAEMAAEAARQQEIEASRLLDPEVEAKEARLDAIEDLDQATFLALAAAARDGDTHEARKILRRAGATDLNLI